MPAAMKRDKYSTYACNELNLFIFFKDQGFFNAVRQVSSSAQQGPPPSHNGCLYPQVVRPHIMSKRAKSFMDHYLLGHNLSAFTRPEVFRTLNAAEQALLAGRHGKL